MIDGEMTKGQIREVLTRMADYKLTPENIYRDAMRWRALLRSCRLVVRRALGYKNSPGLKFDGYRELTIDLATLHSYPENKVEERDRLIEYADTLRKGLVERGELDFGELKEVKIKSQMVTKLAYQKFTINQRVRLSKDAPKYAHAVINNGPPNYEMFINKITITIDKGSLLLLYSVIVPKSSSTINDAQEFWLEAV